MLPGFLTALLSTLAITTFAAPPVANLHDIVIYDYVAEWSSQQWIMEPVFGSSDVRFKNVWTGKYLTVNGLGDYADIKSQALNPSWPSQRWRIND